MVGSAFILLDCKNPAGSFFQSRGDEASLPLLKGLNEFLDVSQMQLLIFGSGFEEARSQIRILKSVL